MTSLILYLKSLVVGIYQFFEAIFLWYIKGLWSYLVDVATYVIDNNIPDPCCVSETILNLQSFIDFINTSAVPGSAFSWLAWFYNLAEFNYGLITVTCALTARFILRRIPFIG